MGKRKGLIQASTRMEKSINSAERARVKEETCSEKALTICSNWGKIGEDKG